MSLFPVLALSTALFCALASGASAEPPYLAGGHVKYRLQLGEVPDDSIYREFVGSPSLDQGADLRLNFGWSGDRISLLADYQLVGRQGDGVRLASELPAQFFLPSTIISDDFRLMDLTHQISQDDSSILVHRLDRLALEMSSTHTVVRLGRQAISWGNGLLYSPMDIFNPFDPAAVDTQYKSGDDMLYGQYLRDNGDDVQAVWVVRRDDRGEVTGEVDSLSAKYHGFAGSGEYDLLLAEHYDDALLAVGGLIDAGGAILRGDWVVTDTQSGVISSLVANISYSWVSGGHNISGILEYYYNGFGQADGNYALDQLASNTELTERLRRGELYTLGRHYIAASALVEMTPLWLLTPNLFVNASDGSALVQVVSSYDIRQDWQWLSALNIPVGPKGTEFGGIETSYDGKTLGSGPSLLIQLGYFF